MQAMLRQHQQTIGGNAQVGAAIAGDVQGDVLVTQQGGQRGGIHFGSGGQFGNISIGDVAGRDIIKTGDISGSGIAIGRGARSDVRTIDTGGGDYAEGDIDKRRGTFVGGDQFNMSGNFSGAILNSKSTLTNVSQSIGAAPHGDAATKAQLQQLIAELSAELQKVPAEQASGGEALLSPAITRRVMQRLAAAGRGVNPALVAELTEREREVLRHIGLGQSNDELAEELVISPATARTYVSRLLGKLQARDRSHLVIIAYESGLVRPGQP